MSDSRTYFILSGLFFAAFLVVQFTSIYGDASWFKVFTLILSASFLYIGINYKRNSKNNAD